MAIIDNPHDTGVKERREGSPLDNLSG